MPEKNDFIGPKQPVQRPHADNITRLEDKIDQLIKSLPDQASKTMIPTETRAHRLVTWMETSWGTRLAAVAGIWLILATLVGFWSEYTIRAEERAARAEEAEFRKLAQIATAWEILLTRAGGNIGKGNALNTLIAMGQQVRGSDLSCEAIGDFENGECINPPQFSDLLIGTGSFWSGDKLDLLEDVTFKGAEINHLRAENLQIDGRFEDVSGFGWTVRNPQIGRLRRVGRDYILDDPKTVFWNFECEYCTFIGGALPPEFVNRMIAPTMIGTHVVYPLSDYENYTIAGPQSGFGGSSTSLLDHPVLFVWGHGGTATNILFQEVIHWDAQQRFDYCANEEDLNFLKNHWSQELSNLQQDALSESEVENVQWIVDRLERRAEPTETIYLEDVSTSAPPNYACGFEFYIVEPLLRPRLLQRVVQARQTANDTRPFVTLDHAVNEASIVPQINVDR